MVRNEERLSALWSEFSQSRNMEVRNSLVMEYIQLVKSIVCRMLPTYRKHVDFDDLMSCGVMGLMDAIDKFDPSKDVKFETYAGLRIKGEIIDQIRKQDWAPISLRHKIKKIEEGYETLESRFGRSVTEKEVADHLSMSVDDVKKTLDESHTFNIVYLDELLVDRVKSDEMLESSELSPEQSFDAKEMKETLANLIGSLSEKEQLVLSLYYYDELTLKEIGQVLGVTESRVSQIHSKAIMSLRIKLKAAVR